MPYHSGNHRLRIATAGFLAISLSNLIGGRATLAQDAASQARSIKEARDLVADLESQAESQRERLRKTEESLRRARLLLESLEASRGPANKPGKSLQASRGPANTPTAEDEARIRAALPAQKIAEQKPWSWSDARADARESASHLGRGYEAEFSPVPGDPSSEMIRLIHEGKEVYSWKGHARSVFVRHGDVLYYADFSPARNGCAIVAVDLNTGRPLWKTRLIGIGERGHSNYSNLINLTFDRKYVVVYGNEAFGRYIELVDPTTGKTVGNRRAPKGEKEADAEPKPSPSGAARE